MTEWLALRMVSVTVLFDRYSLGLYFNPTAALENDLVLPDIPLPLIPQAGP